MNLHIKCKKTYDDLKDIILSNLSSPLWLMVKMREESIPTALYAQQSYKKNVNNLHSYKINQTYIDLIAKTSKKGILWKERLNVPKTANLKLLWLLLNDLSASE